MGQSVFKGIPLSNPSPQDSASCERIGGRQIVRNSEYGKHKGNQAFMIKQNWCTYELTETMAAHTGPAQFKVRWCSNAKRECRHNSLWDRVCFIP